MTKRVLALGGAIATLLSGSSVAALTGGQRSTSGVAHQQFIDPPWPVHAESIGQAVPVTLPPLPLPTTTSSTTTTVPPTTTTTAPPAPPTTTSTTTSAPAEPHSTSGWTGPPPGCAGDDAKSPTESHHCWDSLVHQWSDWPTSTMEAILWCESKGDEWARNPSGAEGLFQDMDGPQDPWQNAVMAHRKWAASGTRPWSSSESCWG